MTVSGANKLKRLVKYVLNNAIGSLNKDAQDGIRRAVKLLDDQRWKMVALIATAFVAAILEGGTMGLLGLAVSVLVGEVDLRSSLGGGPLGGYVSNLLARTSASGLFLLLVGVAVIAQLGKSVLLYVSQAMEISLSYGLKRAIQRQSVSQLMSMSYAQVSQYPPGEIASVIDQSDVVAESVNGVAKITRATLILIAYVCIMVLMSLKMTIATMLVVVILWVSLTRMVQLIRQLGQRTIDAKLILWRWTVEFLGAPRLLRVFNSTGFARDAINQARDEEIFPECKGEIIQAAIKPTIEAITILGAGAFLLVGYALAGNGAQSVVPQLFVYVLIFYRLKPQISAFNEFRAKLAWIIRRFELVGGFLRTSDKEFIQEGGKPFSGLKDSVRFENVTFRYPGTQTAALDNATFSFRSGQTIAIVGPSGAGKSTVLDLFVGLYAPTSGRITVDNKDLAQLDSFQWRDHIGMVDQEVVLLNTSISQNIRFGRDDASREDVERAAKLAHSHEFIEVLSEGYDTPIGEKGFKLSGGQRQRIALARALVRDPGILVLDEATSALDSASEKVIQDAIDEMHDSRTILIVAHRLSTIAKADHIVFLEHGRVVEQGSPAELLEQGGKFAHLWNLQATSV